MYTFKRGYKVGDDVEWMRVVRISDKLTPFRYKLFFGFFETYHIGSPADVDVLRDIDNILRVEWGS